MTDQETIAFLRAGNVGRFRDQPIEAIHLYLDWLKGLADFELETLSLDGAVLAWRKDRAWHGSAA
jgi:hypothetical protein